MNKNVLGIDLGTSSVKVLQRYTDGSVRKVKANYAEISLNGWWDAICQAISELDLEETVSIGLSSQVGTYLVNDRDVISWNCEIGASEVQEIKKKYKPEIFLREISMDHPSIASYPIPRLKYITEHYDNIVSVCQPKDFICEQLTGNRVTDPYSWRGLANLETMSYSGFFLEELGIQAEKLPKMIDYTGLAGVTKEISLTGKVLPAGIPVYVGLNDYYAALLGMGIQNTGDLFDISGTSEHLGIIDTKMVPGTPLVSGPYIKGNVHYGVTSSSGASIQFGLRLLKDGTFDLEEIRKSDPPIFLPYMKGERAPIWDPDARGVFFGVGENCTQEELAYAVFEGVVFSLYHIYETMGSPNAKTMVISGGAAVSERLNFLKAEMFGIPARTLEENDTSAFGAALIAAVGAGWYLDLETAVEDSVKIKETIMPTGIHQAWMRKRYSLYKGLYPAVKEQYVKLKELRS